MQRNLEQAYSLFDSMGHGVVEPLASGMEGQVFLLEGGLVGKLWKQKSLAELKHLKAFYDELKRHSLPLATPEVHQMSQIGETVASVEQRLAGRPLRDFAQDESVEVPPLVVDCLIQVLAALASIPGKPEFAKLAVLDEDAALWRGESDWQEVLGSLIRRRVARFGDQLGKSVDRFDQKLEKLLSLMRTLPGRPLTILHGDLVPVNILASKSVQPTAVLDFGFLSSIGDPAFDAAIATSTFDMYGPRHNLIEDQLTRAVAGKFGYSQKELILYKAAYAVVSSNAYDPAGRDGHFAWCTDLLQRADVCDLLL